MESLKEHVKIATNMYEKKMFLELIKQFEINELKECCSEISRLGIQPELYSEFEIVQKEMIKNTNIIKYLIKLNESGIEPVKVRDFINVIQCNEDKLTNYSVEKIIKALKETKMYDSVSYAYLKYFIDRIKSNLGKKIVIENLKYFFTQGEVEIQDLTSDELALFTSPILSNYNLIPKVDLKKVYELLVQNKGLKKFILFLYLNKLFIPLNIEDYEKLNENTENIHKSVFNISKVIDNESLYRLLLKWVDNGCSIYDLNIIENSIANVSMTELENIISSRSAYINFVYGNKISGLNLKDIDFKKEPLIIYAISNNKKGFLKLIEQNQEEFIDIPSSSILYDENFYTKYVNINSLNLKDLKELKFMINRKNYSYVLKDGIYTFNEIKALYESSNENYYKIYNYLLDLKVDDRILRIRQLINKDLITKYMNDDEIENIASKIKIKSLYNWMEQDFKNIKDIKEADAIEILKNYEELYKVLKEIKNKNELLYVIRNNDIVCKFNSMQELKDNIKSIDKYWLELVNIMKFTREFIDNNKKNIKEFLLRNGAELALKYYKEICNEKRKESFRLIVKSELMGEFKRLKYHTDDLRKEIDFNLEKYQIVEWTDNNINFSNDRIEVGEYDDFYSTMILGEEPMHTCLSYRNGMYNQCLLACFDSNKKILYARVNGKIVARAMVRLTKGSYQNINETQTLSFVDVENSKTTNISKGRSERLTIFLEKSYIAGISDELAEKVKKMFIKILESKAKKMNALLVLSNFYIQEAKTNYLSTKYYMYISNSKAGTQYLDSLNGQASVSDEGQYKASNFLIWKADEK